MSSHEELLRQGPRAVAEPETAEQRSKPKILSDSRRRNPMIGILLFAVTIALIALTGNAWWVGIALLGLDIGTRPFRRGRRDA